MHNLIMVGAASLIIIACLVVLVERLWIVGLLMISMALWQILFICAMGTIFEESSMRFTENIYSIDWHLLTGRQRMYLRLILQMAQKPHLNSIGGCWLANLNAFMMVRRGGETFSKDIQSVCQLFRRSFRRCTRCS